MARHQSLAVIRSLTRKPAARKGTAEAAAEAVAAALGPLFTKLSDDLYNTAVSQNPLAFAVTQGRDLVLTVADAGEVRVTQNDNSVPVAVVVRADGDVTDLLLSGTDSPIADKQIRGLPQATAILRPNQSLFANVRAAVYPVRLIVTTIPLRGRRTVFGG